MTYRYSAESMANLSGLHPILIRSGRKLLETDDHKVIDGVRTRRRQWELYNEGASTVPPGPKAKHLRRDDGFGHAMDIVPFVDGKPVDTSAFGFGVEQAGQFAWMLRKLYDIMVEECARWERETGQKFNPRLGINWDMDHVILTDQGFDDWFHVEIMEA